MPAKNAEKYISQSIISILSQTYSEIELIIFNDTLDNTKEIIYDFKNKDNRVKIINSSDSVGISFALNSAINKSEGKFVARMDADDIADLSRIEKQKLFLEENNLDICGSQISCFKGNNVKLLKSLDFPIKNELIKYSIHESFAHPTIFAKDVLINNPYSSTYDGVEDFELWSRFINNKNIKLGNYPYSLLNYRIHDSQVSSIVNREKIKPLQNKKITGRFILGSSK